MRRLFCLLALIFALPVRADLVVVTQLGSDISHLSADEVTNIFLGRYRRLPSGAGAIPIDQPSGSEQKVAFYRRLVGKEPSEINAYWARLVFSGRTSPPIQTVSRNEVLNLLLAMPGTIAYMERSQVDSRRLRVLFDLSP